MKKVFSALLASALVISLVACGSKTTTQAPSGNEEVVTLTLAHIRPDGSSADLAIEKFAEEAGELSGGTLKFDIYPASQLGEYTVVQERVMIGDVDMQAATIGTNIDKMFGIGNVGYLASTWDEAKKIFGPNGPIQNAYSKKLAERGLTYLCAYPFYFGGIALNVEPVDPTNPDAKSGIKIRVPSMTCYEKTAEGFGYLGTPLPSSETFTSMQTGVVNGAIGMGAEGYYSNLADLVKYYLPINDHFECWHMYINSDKLNSLSAKQQDAIKTAAKNFENRRWDVAAAETEEYEKKLEAKGAKIVKFTDDELKKFGEKTVKNVWPIVKDEYGAELFDACLDALK